MTDCTPWKTLLPKRMFLEPDCRLSSVPAKDGPDARVKTGAFCRGTVHKPVELDGLINECCTSLPLVPKLLPCKEALLEDLAVMDVDLSECLV